jgi:hypothetical protein
MAFSNILQQLKKANERCNSGLFQSTLALKSVLMEKVFADFVCANII